MVCQEFVGDESACKSFVQHFEFLALKREKGPVKKKKHFPGHELARGALSQVFTAGQLPSISVIWREMRAKHIFLGSGFTKCFLL